MAADLSIIALSRSLEYFERLDRALTILEPGDVETILVNNAGRPQLTASAIRRGWAVIEPGYNTSFSGGNNLAARAATGDYLLLLNDDLIPGERFLEALWNVRRSADVVGALLLHADGTVNHAGTLVRPTGQTDHIGRHEEPGKFIGNPNVPAATFAAAMIRRGIWDELGGLDERYFYGWEDTDFCLRVLRAGGNVRCCRAAVAVHDECGTRPRGSQTDAANHAVFMGTWKDALPELLRAYAERCRPDLEGV